MSKKNERSSYENYVRSNAIKYTVTIILSIAAIIMLLALGAWTIYMNAYGCLILTIVVMSLPIDLLVITIRGDL